MESWRNLKKAEKTRGKLKKPVENWKLADMTNFLAHSYLITRELRLKTQSLNLVLLIRVHVHVCVFVTKRIGQVLPASVCMSAKLGFIQALAYIHVPVPLFIHIYFYSYHNFVTKSIYQ